MQFRDAAEAAQALTLLEGATPAEGVRLKASPSTAEVNFARNAATGGKSRNGAGAERNKAGEEGAAAAASVVANNEGGRGDGGFDKDSAYEDDGDNDRSR